MYQPSRSCSQLIEGEIFHEQTILETVPQHMIVVDWSTLPESESESMLPDLFRKSRQLIIRAYLCHALHEKHRLSEFSPECRSALHTASLPVLSQHCQQAPDQRSTCDQRRWPIVAGYRRRTLAGGLSREGVGVMGEGGVGQQEQALPQHWVAIKHVLDGKVPVRSCHGSV